MASAVKDRPPVVVPPAVLRRAGFKRGQELEFKASGGVITILAKAMSADDEYTPEQRRAVEARLAEAEEDVAAGRLHGPFTARQAAAYVERLSKRRTARKTRRRQ